MNTPMKAFWDGLAEFISDFWRAASRQGFAIMLLLFANIALVYWIRGMTKAQEADALAHKHEIAELRNECRRELEGMRVEIDTLSAEMQKCIEARARLEAQNLFFQRQLKRLKLD